MNRKEVLIGFRVWLALNRSINAGRVIIIAANDGTPEADRDQAILEVTEWWVKGVHRVHTKRFTHA